MGAGSFKADTSNLYKSCIEYDDGTVSGAAGAAWSLVNCFVPGFILQLGYVPAYHINGDHIPLLVAFVGCFITFWPASIVFVGLLVPGAIAAGCGAVYGLIRGN